MSIRCLFAVFLTSRRFFQSIMGKPRNWRGLWIPDYFVSVNSKGKVWYALITFLHVDILQSWYVVLLLHLYNTEKQAFLFSDTTG